MNKLLLRVSLLLYLCLASAMGLHAQNQDRLYKVALLLPFNSKAAPSNLNVISHDYYSGVKLALKAMKKEGLNVRFYVFDSEKDSSGLESILSHPDMPKMDLIIGPFYDAGLNQVEQFSTKYHIPVVSPLRYHEPTEETTVMNFFTSDSMLLMASVEKAYTMMPKHHYVLIAESTGKSKRMQKMAESQLQKLGCAKLKSVVYENSTFTPELTAGADSTVLIICTSLDRNKATYYNLIKDKKSAYLLAHPDWLERERTAPASESNFPKIIYPETTVPSKDSVYLKFEKSYKKAYFVKPTRYSYIGYDETVWLCYGLMAFGPAFYEHLPQSEFRGLMMDIMFKMEENKSCLNYGVHFVTKNWSTLKEFKP